MSAWDAYITNMKAKGLQLCAIYGKEGGLWAKSSEWNPTQAEICAIVKGISDKNFGEGIFLDGLKYTLIGLTDDSVTAKCSKATSPDNAKYLVHISLAKTCVVLGGIAGANERSATTHVEEIKDYLAKSNY